MYCKLPTDKWSFCPSSIKAAIEEVLFKLFWSWPKAIGLKYTQLPLPWRLCSLCVCTSSCFLLWNTSGKVWKVKGGAVSGFRLNISGVFFWEPFMFHVTSWIHTAHVLRPFSAKSALNMRVRQAHFCWTSDQDLCFFWMSTRLRASSRPIVMPSDTKFIVLDFVYSVLIVLEFVVVVIVVVKNRPLKKDVGRLQSF